MTKREELAMLHERHAELTEALARMSKAKRGTRFETDRIRERENIGRQIDRLEHIPPTPRGYVPQSADEPLWPEDEQPEQPEQPARPVRSARRLEPSPEDQAWYCQASAAGMFRRPTP